jgi:hypothetical protein
MSSEQERIKLLLLGSSPFSSIFERGDILEVFAREKGRKQQVSW